MHFDFRPMLPRQQKCPDLHTGNHFFVKIRRYLVNISPIYSTSDSFTKPISFTSNQNLAFSRVKTLRLLFIIGNIARFVSSVLK